MKEESKDQTPKFSGISKEIRERLESKLGKLPSDVLIEFGAGPVDLNAIQDGKIKTDWPDSFDRNSWYKTWAKGGAAELPSDHIAQRAAARKLKGHE